MKKLRKMMFRGLALTAMTLFIVACSDDDNDPVDPLLPANTITDVAIATPDLSNLVAAVGEANLASTLAGAGPFTVFAPTNAAFAAFLDANGFASVEEVPDDLLEQVLLNHVVAGENGSASLSTGYISSSSTAGANGLAISLFVNTADGVRVNGATVTTADVPASNGVIHIVDQVIGLPNIVDHATLNPELTELVGALTADGNTNFTGLLSSEDQDFTVFAPVNAGFMAYTNENDYDINNVLSNHVIAGAALASAGLETQYAKTAAVNEDGDAISIYVNTADGVVLNGGSTVAIADIVATNGIIHAVDAVIDLPTVVTFAVADSANFSSLVGALQADGQPDFVTTLSTPWGTDPAPFTVFAPINAAFDALDAIPEGEALTAVLQHHVIPGANIVSGDLSDGLVSPETLEGDTLTFTAEGDSFTITDGLGNQGVAIVVADVQAINGVVHAIDAVLLPDTEN